MTWMLTSSGKAFELSFVAQDQIDIHDIAHHLAQINRYTGACSRPYSVAEHSLFAAWIVETVLGETNPNVIMAALMHDAHEAYTSDLSSPMKQEVGKAWAAVEARVQHAVLKRYGLLATWAASLPRIHWADMTALVTERAQLLPAGGPAWAAEATHQPLPESTWCFADVDDFAWHDWRDTFVERFAELQFAREQYARDLTGEIGSGP